MTRCTWPVSGKRDRQECGHRACALWDIDGGLPRCRKHITKEALERAAAEGVRLVELPA